METTSASNDATSRALSRELEIVNGAIEMVASGGARRVLVASLRFGDELIGPARRSAARRGTEVTPTWSGDDHVTALSVARVGG